MEGNTHKGDMGTRLMKIKPWEAVLAIVIIFMVGSASLYWYDYFDKTRSHTIESEMRAKWEKDTQKWQDKVTNYTNALGKSQREMIDIINTNIQAGRLIVKEKK